MLVPENEELPLDGRHNRPKAASGCCRLSVVFGMLAAASYLLLGRQVIGVLGEADVSPSNVQELIEWLDWVQLPPSNDTVAAGSPSTAAVAGAAPKVPPQSNATPHVINASPLTAAPQAAPQSNATPHVINASPLTAAPQAAPQSNATALRVAADPLTVALPPQSNATALRVAVDPLTVALQPQSNTTAPEPGAVPPAAVAAALRGPQEVEEPPAPESNTTAHGVGGGPLAAAAAPQVVAVAGAKDSDVRGGGAAGSTNTSIVGNATTPVKDVTPARVTPALAINASATPVGLPEPLPGPTPSWVLNEDLLIEDARRPGGGGGGMLIAHAVLVDRQAAWGSGNAKAKELLRPRWLRAILTANRAHARRHGHAMLIRWKPTLELTPFQARKCHDQNETDKCVAEFERDNFNWEKEQMMFDYLESPENFTHVFVLDADAAFVHPTNDTMAIMAKELDDAGKDLLLTDEDWLKSGKGRINGGFLFARNSNFTRNLMKDLMDAHWFRTTRKSRLNLGNLACPVNEQLCLNGMKGRKIFEEHTKIASGSRFNRGGCVLFQCGSGGGPSDPTMKVKRLLDPSLEIMHFMGVSKTGAAKELCETPGLNLTQEGPGGYGCAR